MTLFQSLSTDGFRKVVALENGMITAEKNSVIEFQHPFFKQGNAHLLENIKRKVSLSIYLLHWFCYEKKLI